MAHLVKYFLYLFSTLAVLAAGLLVYLIWLQPPFYFPNPTGPYAVGIQTYHWIDTNRKETLDNDPTHPNRELMVNIWYPASGTLTEKPTNPYASYFVDYCKKNHKKTWFSLGLSRPIYSYAQPEAHIAQNNLTYPVIIFSHGYLCTRDSNTAQCEELASHGYIVVGISHTYDSCVVQFPDGHIVDGEASMTKRLPSKKLIERFKQRDQEIEIWAADVRFVLDQIELLTDNKKSPFYQRFDRSNIGMFGHSFGGSTAIQVCQRDARVKAGVNLDWGLLGSDMTKKIDKPLMFILSDDIKEFERPWAQDDWKKFGISSLEEEKLFKLRRLTAVQELAKSIGHDVYTLIINKAKHKDFNDWVLLKHATLFSRFWSKLDTGSINGFRATKIINAYLINFFDKYLKGQPSELLDGKSMKYPEVETKKWA